MEVAVIRLETDTLFLIFSIIVPLLSVLTDLPLPVNSLFVWGV